DPPEMDCAGRAHAAVRGQGPHPFPPARAIGMRTGRMITAPPLSGQPAHDDLLISAALSTVLDDQPLPSAGETLIVPGRDPLRDLDRGF
ncbi:MAG: hypothetical protein ACK4SN_15310, partial [Bellilinea sp.]